MSSELTLREHVVYWLFDTDGVLLYIGMTHDLAGRLAQHAMTKDWWWRVDPTLTATRVYPSHDDAAEGEIAALAADEPSYNVRATRHVNPGKSNMVMRSLRVPEALWNAAKTKADERQENLSDVIREALERYVRRKS